MAFLLGENMIVVTELLADKESAYAPNNKGNYKGNIYIYALYVPKIRYI